MEFAETSIKNRELLNDIYSAVTVPEWAKSMTWKGIKPVVTLCRKTYEKGVSLSKAAMREV